MSLLSALAKLQEVEPLDSKVTLLKFVCPCISHCASHYHYASQSVHFLANKNTELVDGS